MTASVEPAPSSGEPTRGVVYTFYSFKGGVGRSMALANTAALLSRWGKKVLIIDWDLEAPGIEKFFQRWITGSRRSTPGLVDIICDFADGSPRDWQDCLLKARLPEHQQEIHILSAGQDDPREATGEPTADYGRNLQRIKWDVLFGTMRLGAYLERLRREWTAKYDFVLVDSRTGITDIGGICTIHLPDVLVCLFTTTEQSLQGVKDVIVRAKAAHAALPVDRRRLMIVPLPARDESRTEYKLAKEWRARFASELERFYRDWVPKDESAESVLDLLKIPYVAFWSFGERLPVLDEDVDNPDKLAYFYQLVARLILGQLDLREVRQGTLTTQVSEQHKAEAAKRTDEAAALREKAQRETAEREQENRDKEKEERQLRYERYSSDRIRSMVAQLRFQGNSLLLLALVLLAGLGYGITWFSVSTQTYPFGSTWLLTLLPLAILVVLATAYAGHLLRGRAKDLLAERFLFESQAGPYTEPDYLAVGMYVERSERIIARSLFGRRRVRVPSDGSAGWERSLPPTPVPESPVRAPVTSHDAENSSWELADLTVKHRGDSYDVYVSWHRDPFVEKWLKEFLPLFTSCVSDLAGRRISTFVDQSVLTGSQSLPEELLRAVERSTCLLAIVTPAYFNSEWTKREWEAFTRERPHSVVPVLLRGSFTALPADVQGIQLTDFNEYAFVGEGFQKTAAYVEFQTQIRRLGERAADIIGTSEARALK